MKNPWKPIDIALLGLSALSCALIIFFTDYLITGPMDHDIGAASTVLKVCFWIALVVAFASLVVAGIVKVVAVGVRSAND